MKKLLLMFVALAFLQVAFSQQEARLLRFPAIYDDQVVFTFAGDLYTVDKSGGMARKLTSGTGYEMFARFSPDGKNIAFTGQYDGNTEVFLIPAEGGSPKRLTYTATLGRDDISDRMGPNNIVMTWKDNENIVYRSRKKSFNSFKGQLFVAHTGGGLSDELPLPSGGFCSFSPDGKKLAYNQVFREFRTWKYYKGGMADDIWIYDFETKETKNITNNVSQDIFPMWFGDEIYFLSDRDRIMNMFAYNVKTGETRKVTNYTEYDIKFPSLGNESIIYENGGYLYNFDFASQKAKKIDIEIADDVLVKRTSYKDASKFISSYAVSPDGKRVTFGARGDVWSVPAKEGITRNLTATSGVHERSVGWSPDGKYISFISDKTGEDEIFIMKQDGSEEAIQITYKGDTYKYGQIWSPDSKKLLWSDKMQRVRYVDIDTKEIVEVEQTPDGEIRDYSWSPDSRWITYSKPQRGGMSRIWAYNVETKEKKPVTDTWYDSSNPVFGTEGNYLFFTSSRDFNPIYSWTEWNHAYTDMNKIYFITLRKDVKNPFAPENDEVQVKENKPEGDKKNEKVKEGKGDDQKTDSENIDINFDGIIDRIIVLPGQAGSYWNITPVGKKVYYSMYRSGSSTKMMVYDLEKQKSTELGNYGSFIVSANHKKMLIGARGKYAVINIPGGKINLSDYVDLSNMKVWVNLKEEWNQIYNEAWRQMRDFFYDPDMHGLDWNAIHDKYQPLVPYVDNRNDLNYIIGEMIGELSIGHAYISGGDKPKPKRIKTGLLGAELSRDESGYYRIDSILKGENWTRKTRSPLTEIGVDVKQGDFVIAVNGKPTNNMVDIYQSLLGLAGKEVELTVNGSADENGSRKVLIKPLTNESGLYYYNWVQRNIKIVNDATDGEVGYIHIPDMGVDGLNEFVKHYYPQLMKKALIIDDRGNGGGNVSPMIIERLSRELTMFTIARNGSPTTKPEGMMLGPKVLLIDSYSASDGDLFPYQFRKLRLGKIIGTRSWGGVVGIRGALPFIDGGQLRKPEFAPFDTEGKKFIIEGHGIDPDIVVHNDPAKEYAGEDQQLNKAIEVILDELKNYHEEWPKVPDYPDKSK